MVQEIVRLLKANTTFMNTRPLRHSLALDPNLDCLPQVSISIGKRNLRLHDAILRSYHHNEVRFSELTLDTFRMLQCLEWEPNGLFYQSSGASLTGMGTKIGQNGSSGHSRINYSHDITDPSLPPNHSSMGPTSAWPPSNAPTIGHMSSFCFFIFWCKNLISKL